MRLLRHPFLLSAPSLLVNPRHHPIVYSAHYSPPEWPARHAFPMMKFKDTHTHLATSIVNELQSPLILSASHTYTPQHSFLPALRSPPHDADYVNRFLTCTRTKEERERIGFKDSLTDIVVNRTLAEISGTCLAATLALDYKLATTIAGGTHHAFPNFGSGYTILNDLVIASHYLLSTVSSGVSRVLVIDCDVHQGDGTAYFSQQPLFKNKMFTLSVHAKENFPFEKRRSSYDVELESGAGDEEYMEAIEPAIEQALKECEPDLVIYDAGVDVLAEDRLGKLQLTVEGMRRRDRFVIERCVEGGFPIACVVGGGYNRDGEVLAKRHAVVHEEAARVWRERQLWRARA